MQGRCQKREEKVKGKMRQREDNHHSRKIKKKKGEIDCLKGESERDRTGALTMQSRGNKGGAKKKG